MAKKKILDVCDIEEVKNETVKDLLMYLMDNAEAIYRMEPDEFIALQVSYLVGFFGINDEQFVKEAVTRVYNTVYDLSEYLK